MASRNWLILSVLLGVPLSLPTELSAQTQKPAASAKATTAAKTTAANSAKPSAAVAPKPASAGVQGAVGPAVSLPRIYAPTRPREVAPKYPWKEKIATTIFWIGETPTQNNPTPNHKSSWDVEWQINFGGFDDPNPAARNWDFTPKGFVPRLNPFYCALPFNDVTNREIAKIKIPWHKEKWNGRATHSVCENRWVAIRYGNKICYTQWSDCGPFNTTDHDYVFGNARPKNFENDGAGLDVSPAVRDYLGISSGALCDWRFVEESEVPDGPWRRYGTNNSFVKNEATELAKLRAQYAELVKKRDEWLNNNIDNYRNNNAPKPR
jgi:hypothetical protein